MISGDLTITSTGGKMPAYLARPSTGVHPAVIVLEAFMDSTPRCAG